MGKVVIGSFMVLAVLGLDACKDKDPAPQGPVLINEISASQQDWVELYNASGAPIDISGYFIYDNVAAKYTIPSGTSIPAQGYLVLICDGTATGLHTGFSLSEKGETLTLENTTSTVVDQVVFPGMDLGQTYGRYGDGANTWALSGLGTEGATNGTKPAPAFVRVIRTPLVPLMTNAVTVQTEFSDPIGIVGVTLFYRIDGGAYTSVPMVALNNVYSAPIPALGKVGKVDYYMEAKTVDKTSYSPYNASLGFYSYLINTDALPNLVINEFMADNTLCCPDMSSGLAEYDDWIEVYNAGTTAVDIGGYYLSDDKLNPFGHQVPTGNPVATTIAPKSRIVLWADGSPSQGPLHLGFKLSALGEDLGLYYVDGRTIDVLTFGAQSQNMSFGRSPDGGTVWKVFNMPTQGTANP